MNISKIGKIGLSVLGVTLTLASGLINDKVKNDQMEETIAKKVAEALAKNSES